MIIQWETISTITTIPWLLDSWSFASIPIDITTDQYLISQVFEGSDLFISAWPAIVLLVLLTVCLITGLSLATDLSRFWFLASQIAFIFVMVGFKLEQLLMFDRTDKAGLILAFLMYLPTSYYFHAINRNVSLLARMLVFMAISIAFGLIIYWYSGVTHPFLYLVGYGVPVALALTVIFILFTGHEIIYGFLVLITRSNTPNSNNSFFHFFAISIIYLGNVLLLFLKNTRRIDWDFYYLDAFWILIAASIIGIWSLRQRGDLFRNIMPVEPHGVIGYLCLCILSFATIGYFFSTANDPAIEALEDAIVYSQLSLGFVFLLYILFNFRGVLIANLKVYKVVYKPKKMPFFSMRIGGFIGVLGLFLVSNQYPLNQAITAYYNGIGDLHRVDDKPLLAKEYYKLAAVYAQTNHRSNYAIAAMENKSNNSSEALAYFKLSIIKQPTPYAFVNTANLYQQQGSFFKALFTLKDGLEKFPGDPYISNNLAGLYAKTDLLDSAFYYLGNLENNKSVSKTIQTNKLALLTRSKVYLPVDSMYQGYDHQYPEIASNLLLMANNQNKWLNEPLVLPTDTLLNPITFAWWYNFNLNSRLQDDSLQMSFSSKLSAVSENELYSSTLDFANTIKLKYSGNVASAFLLMRELQFLDSDRSGYYNDILGQWSLQYGQPRLAIEYFDRATGSGYLPALWHKSVALAETGEYEEATRAWNTYAYRIESPEGVRVPDLLAFCKEDGPVWDSLTDQGKYWHLRFKSKSESWAQKSDLLEDIRDPKIFTEAEIWLWNAMLGVGDVKAMATYWQVYQTDSLTANLRSLQLKLLSGRYNDIKVLDSDLMSNDSDDRLWNLFAMAKLAENRADKQQASNYYRRLLRNPFFEQGILAAAEYFGAGDEDDYLAYEILLDAISINQYSVKLLKAYGVQCARLNLETYKETTLETLESLLTATEFSHYRSQLEALSNQSSGAFE